jgi:hypothetical protein
MSDNRSLTMNFGVRSTEFIKGVTEIKNALTELNSKYRENQETTKFLENEQKALIKQYENLEKTIVQKKENLKNASAKDDWVLFAPETIKRHEDELKELETAITSTTQALNELKTEEQLLKPQIDGTNKMLKQQYNEFMDLEKSASQAASGLDDVGDGAVKASGNMRGTQASLTGLIGSFRTGNVSAGMFARVLSNPTPIAIFSLALAGLVALVKDFSSASEEAHKRLEAASQAFAKSAEASRRDYEELKNLISEYEKIGSITDKTSEEKNKLIDIQDKINSTYLTEAERLDLVNGGYRENIALLREASDEKLKRAKEDAAQQLLIDTRLFENPTAKPITINPYNAIGIANVSRESLNAIEEMSKEILRLDGYAEDFIERLSKSNFIGVFDIKGNAEEQIEALRSIQRVLLENGDEHTKLAKHVQDSLDIAIKARDNYNNAVRNSADLERTAADATNHAVNAAERAAKAIDRQKTAVENNSKAASALAREAKNLSNAFAEVNEHGSLTVDTTLALIDAGYAAILQKDKETGAVRLNAEAYRDLAKAKKEEQQADYNMQIRELQREKSRILGSIGSNHAGVAAAPRLKELDEQIKVLQAQSDAVGMLVGNINNITAGTYGRSTPSTTRSQAASSEAKDEAARLASVQAGFEKAARERLDWINREQRALKDKHDREMAAINEEIRRRKELNDDRSFNDKLEQLNARLRFEQLDEFSRLNIENEKRRLEQEREDVLFERDAMNRKDALSNRHGISTDALSRQSEQINAALAGLRETIQRMNTPAVQNTIRNQAYNYATSNSFNFTQPLTQSQINRIIKDAQAGLFNR